jgi:hypothetical protein
MGRFAYIEPFPLLLDASPATSRGATLEALEPCLNWRCAIIGIAVTGVRRRLFGVVNGFKRSGP